MVCFVIWIERLTSAVSGYFHERNPGNVTDQCECVAGDSDSGVVSGTQHSASLLGMLRPPSLVSWPVGGGQRVDAVLEHV